MSITNPHGVPTASVPEIPGTRFDADVLANLELAGFPHWVCWTYELRDGERTKPLLNATTGRYAKSNDPSTWTTFDSAVGRGLREGWGVGFVFHATLNPFAGVDLDKCRCPDTAVLSPWAQSMVRAFNSYVEVSPSATGVKLVVRGKPKHNGRKAGTDGSAVETYGTGRYFTLTGWALARSTIGDGQRMLDRLCDRLWPPPPPPPPRPAGRLHLVTMSDATVLDRARRARNGALFGVIWAKIPTHD